MPDFSAPEQDVVISGFVSLSRNRAALPFTGKMDEFDAEENIIFSLDALDRCGATANYHLRRMADLGEYERGQLADKMLIGKSMLRNTDTTAALISVGETVSILLNEEDHLRIIGHLPGLQLDRASEMAFQAETEQSVCGRYAFDEQFGYLTRSPLLTGTGMKAKVLLHLPICTRGKQIPNLQRSAEDAGLVLKSMQGEMGFIQNTYLLTNRASMGCTEEDIVIAVNAMAKEIAQRERDARQALLKNAAIALSDTVMRAAGICANARIMSIAEFSQRANDLRMGAAIGLLKVHVKSIDDLVKEMQPSSLRAASGKELRGINIDIYRAEMLRKRIPELAF